MIDIKDCRTDIYTNSSPNVDIRITHLPTGISVEYSGLGLYKQKEAALKDLAYKVKTFNQEG